MAAKKTSPAEQLIAKATSAKAELPDAARAELATLMDHNAGATKAQRVSADAAIEMLKGFGLHMARTKFDKLIVRTFGRKWGAA